ncbi:MAG: hypothetical protein ABI947_14155 [Chloroflexota bacterium]
MSLHQYGISSGHRPRCSHICLACDELWGQRIPRRDTALPCPVLVLALTHHSFGEQLAHLRVPSASYYHYRMGTTPPQRRSPRLKNYDYTQAGAYFVTICAHQRQPLFGYVTDADEMIRSVEGQMAHDYWHTIPDHFPMVELDGFVVMPNHIHGILVLGETAPPQHRGQPIESFGTPVLRSLSTVIRSYKSIVTRTSRAITGSEGIVWQGRFHDHIIRHEDDLHRIQQYVANNPARWHDDTFYTGHDWS